MHDAGTVFPGARLSARSIYRSAQWLCRSLAGGALSRFLFEAPRRLSRYHDSRSEIQLSVAAIVRVGPHKKGPAPSGRPEV